MRPTWHFIAPEDIRWLPELTAPRVHAAVIVGLITTYPALLDHNTAQFDWLKKQLRWIACLPLRGCGLQNSHSRKTITDHAINGRLHFNLPTI
jgi:hypothetical protein